MDILKGLEQVDACLDKINVSGADVFQMVHARQLLKAIFDAVKADSKVIDKED